MKIFYSELIANPAYYSFGYSIYGLFEEGDVVDECYEKGFLPFVGAREQEPNTMYQARGVRVLAQEFHKRHYHERVIRKAEGVLKGSLSVSTLKKEEVDDKEAVIDFFATYFSFRFGKDSVSKERLLAIWNSPFLTHITEYKLGEKVIAYALEVHGENFIHVWHQAYTKHYTGTHLGAYLYLELIERTKQLGKQFVYFGVTYGNWMRYKTNFQPLEYWDGSEWIADAKSVKLKELFKGDSTRLLGFVDEWRKTKDPFYQTPFPFNSPLQELRLLSILGAGAPRLIGLLLLLIAALAAYAWLAVFAF